MKKQSILLAAVLAFGCGNSNLRDIIQNFPTFLAGTTRVSVDSGGGETNASSSQPSISADSRFVAFRSSATNLVANDSNADGDIFVHDRQTGATTRVSVNSAGVEGDDSSSEPSISADGRFVAFESEADNLAANDTNAAEDVFVHDRQTGTTTLISVNSNGEVGNDSSSEPSISADGRFVVFDSRATNLVANDTNATADVFVHDRQTGTTTRVSVDSGGVEANSVSGISSISADGRFVSFRSFANNLVANDTNGVFDVFVHDRQSGATTRVSVDSAGVQANADSGFSSLSADGRFVAFDSNANNLVANDTNTQVDAFVHDRQTGITTRVSVDSAAAEANDRSLRPSLSADGRFVAFESEASNLVANDNNGVFDVFVRDLQASSTFRVSVDSGGAEGNGESGGFVSISADGLAVAFASFASNLVNNDNNTFVDIFVNQRQP